MPIKGQDVVILLKLLAEKEHLSWTQSQLSHHLLISVSEINAGLKRLTASGLIRTDQQNDSGKVLPNIRACEEFLLFGVKYTFPAQLGEITRGIATCYAAPLFKNKIAIGTDPVPVWPYATGNQKGFALQPLYSSVPDSITKYPDQNFYELLVLVDTLRHGRVRERNIAIKLIKEKLNNE